MRGRWKRWDVFTHQVIVGMTEWGVDYSFDCTGNVEVRVASLAPALTVGNVR